MDSEIEFGDVEEERPRAMRRPDEDRHFSVTACGAPRDADLKIYVDLDAMVDMENHAQTNTSVELGGVLLGGQYVDGAGQPFVVVSDCLRADHFEATKGSFKFTHETWSDIQRRLQEYPDDLRMVGWYHTHPDWGVFLSGMDMFICDNFFNKPLDLALVIDPCRDDRGWFQWVTDGRRGTLRTGGFYLTSSRFREEELNFVAEALEGGSGMPLATRSGSQTSGGFGAPVVNVVQDRSSSQWVQVAVLGSLTLQTVLLALLAFSLLGRGVSSDADARLEASRETLDIIAKEMGGERDFTKKISDLRVERNKLQTELDALIELREEHTDKLKTVNDSLSEARKGEKTARQKIDKLETEIAAINAENKRLKKTDSGSETAGFDWRSPWLWTVIAVSIAIVLAGVLMFRSSKATEDFIDDHPSGSPRSASPPADDFKDSPDGTNTN
jgi:proteasome lid subunit RPN8/RPN11